MLQPKKLKYQLLKEKFFEAELEFLTYTYNRFKDDELKRFQKKHNIGKSVSIANDPFGYASYSQILSDFYDNLFQTFFEKTDEDLFLSYWKEKDTSSLTHKKEFFRLMGASDMLDSSKKSFGKYFIMYKFVLSKKKIATERGFRHFNTVKNLYYLTLDEIKNKFEFIPHDEYQNIINEFLTNETKQNKK
jgi:hypothetical protein